MKKILVSMVGLTALAGCSSNYDYYKGDIKYIQDGPDCVYSAVEQGDRFSKDIVRMAGNRTIVYRNTLCANLYDNDAADTTTMAPVVATPAATVVEPAVVQAAPVIAPVTAPVVLPEPVVAPIVAAPAAPVEVIPAQAIVMLNKAPVVTEPTPIVAAPVSRNVQMQQRAQGCSTCNVTSSTVVKRRYFIVSTM